MDLKKIAAGAVVTGLAITAIGASQAIAAPAAPAPAPAPVASAKWHQTKLINDANIESAQRILTDGDRVLVPMSDVNKDVGNVNLYRANGTFVNKVALGFQPCRIAKTAPNTYWAQENNGRTHELKVVGGKLAGTGQVVQLGSGYSASLTAVGTTLVGVTDNGTSTMFTSFNTTTKKAAASKLDGVWRAGNYATAVKGQVVTAVGDENTHAAQLVTIDTATAKIMKRVPTTSATQGMTTGRDGNLWVVDSGKLTVSKVEPSTGKVLKTIKINVGADAYPLDIAFSGSLNKLAVSGPSALVGRSGVMVIDPTTGAIEADVHLTGDYPSSIAFDSSNKIWTANLRHRHGANQGGTISILAKG